MSMPALHLVSRAWCVCGPHWRPIRAAEAETYPARLERPATGPARRPHGAASPSHISRRAVELE
jgi:hypothetical protein